MDPVVIIVFAVVYFGMMVGRIHGLALDRTGIALLGAIALLAAGRVGLQEAWDAVDVATIALLLGLMIVSAQLRLGGFYSRLAGAVVGARVSPAALLALLIGVAGLLSAVLVNDVVCLAMAPVLVEGCGRRGLNPVPFLLALACAANVGSAATLIGNPQNILIGQVLHLSFTRYLLMAGVPSALGLALTWLIIRAVYRNRWQAPAQLAQAVAPPYSAWQTAKGLAVVGALMAAFLFTPWPRAVLALSAGALLLTSRRMASRPMLAAVDWHLLVLFVGLFVVNHVVGTSGLLARRWSSRTWSRTCPPPCSCCRRPPIPWPGRSWRWPARWPATCSSSAASPTSSWWTRASGSALRSRGWSTRRWACRSRWSHWPSRPAGSTWSQRPASESDRCAGPP
jgi:Na+/H+ antiporter NhaD/arsenite permease-like protein